MRSTPQQDGVRRRGDGSEIGHVCMFVNNAGTGDSRVVREAEVAVAAGFRVTVIAAPQHDENPPPMQVQRGVTFLSPKVSSSRIAASLRRSWHGTARPADSTGQQIPANSGTTVRSGRSGNGGDPKGLRHVLWAKRRQLASAAKRLGAGLSLHADIYHAHDCDTLGLAWACAQIRGRPLLYDSHELWYDWAIMRGASKLEAKFWWVFEGLLVRQCDLCIIVSEGLVDIFRQRHRSAKVLAVRNCPHTPTRQPEVDRAAVRREYDIEPDAPLVVYQGAILDYRGLETLIEAAAQLPEVRFLLVGRPNEYADHLKRLAERVGARNVRFLGHKPEAERNRTMAASDLGVALIQDRSLSYRHSFANKNSEYFANCLPVLASDLPEHRRVIDRIGAGLFADPNDPVDVLRKVREFFALPKRQRREMGLRGRRAVEAELNMEKQMEPVLAFYRECIRKRSEALR